MKRDLNVFDIPTIFTLTSDSLELPVLWKAGSDCVLKHGAWLYTDPKADDNGEKIDVGFLRRSMSEDQYDMFSLDNNKHSTNDFDNFNDVVPVFEDIVLEAPFEIKQVDNNDEFNEPIDDCSKDLFELIDWENLSMDDDVRVSEDFSTPNIQCFHLNEENVYYTHTPTESDMEVFQSVLIEIESPLRTGTVLDIPHAKIKFTIDIPPKRQKVTRNSSNASYFPSPLLVLSEKKTVEDYGNIIQEDRGISKVELAETHLFRNPLIDTKETILGVGFESNLFLDYNDGNWLMYSNALGIRNNSKDDFSNPRLRFMNLSSDSSEKYRVDDMRGVVGKVKVQHALFARNLLPPFFKTNLTLQELEYFHRPRVICKRCTVRLARERKKVHTKKDIKYIPKKEKELSCRDGSILLIEYIEERPTVMMNVGMASQILLYYRLASENDNNVPEFAYGPTVPIPYNEDDETFFMGKIRRGRQLAGLTCNMLTAPLFIHDTASNYFIITRKTGHQSWYIRDMPKVFTAGQVNPRIEIPAPASRAANIFIKTRLNVEILRLFRSNAVLKISDLLEMFPTQSDASIRARLKEVGGESYARAWKLKPEVIIPSDFELQEMLTPEEICGFHIMQAGKAELERTGIESMTTHINLSKFLLKTEGRVDEQSWRALALYIEEVLKLSCWNLSRNFLKASRKEFMLLLYGPGNPLARGEGFCFFRAGRPKQDDSIPKIKDHRKLTKLNKKELKDALRKFHIPEDIIVTLKLWEMYRLLEEKSTSAVLAGQKTEYARFARAKPHSPEYLRSQYEQDSQKIFERQWKTLSLSIPSSHISVDGVAADNEMDQFARDLEQDLLDDQSKASGTNAENEIAQYQDFLREQRMKLKENADDGKYGECQVGAVIARRTRTI